MDSLNTKVRCLLTASSLLSHLNRRRRLSQGIKTKSLLDHISLSMSAIEKRKKQLKLLFSVEDGKDETLLEMAKEKGFI